jgi:EAL and modified HD-GYP domain-containing signal transduction protein
VTLTRDPSTGEPQVAVVRQPIADERHGVVGYELLFGDNEGRRLDPARDPKATSALLIDAFGDIGLDTLAGRHPAWVSIARNFLVEIGPPPVRPDRAVLQIAAYPAQDDLLAELQKLGRSGYTIALDDYDGRPDIEELLGLCSIVKVNVAGLDGTELREAIAHPKMHGALLVATGVSEPTEFELCRALGFSYFQGEFFAKPRVIRHRSVGTGGLASLRAMGRLCASDTGFDDLERIISSDVGLSLKLLRYINSAFFALPRTIGSVREALTLLGARTVRRWAMVMAMSALPGAPHELIAIALHRARMCEMLAGSAQPEERETLFTIGLFSVADGLLQAPMEDVLDSLPFSEEIRAALLRHEGPKGELLHAVIAYERGEFPALPTPAATPTATATDAAAEGASGNGVMSLAGAYRAALEWADEAGRLVA